MGTAATDDSTRIGQGIELGGRTTQQDLIIVKPNYLTVDEKIIHLFAVFDGHGSYGDKAAKEASRLLCEEIKTQKNGLLTSPLETLKSIFNNVQELLIEDMSWDHHVSGTTATVALLIDKHLHIANVGDSKLVIMHGKDILTGTKLTIDHTCENESEKERVLAKGARLERLMIDGKYDGPLRLFKGSLPYPGIAVTRSFGNSSATKVGVTSEPSVCTIELNDMHKYVVLASDGLWDGISINSVAEICTKSTDAVDCAKMLMDAAKKGLNAQNIDDNISEIVVPLKNGQLQIK